jgi:2-dehydro-3-deoxyphosphogluconate aldolase/(4S)-4-hydroxy-2-oxoglutarate aldolase
VPLPPREVEDALARERLLSVVRLDDEDAVDPVVEALVGGGLRVVELTLTTPGALAALARLRPTVPVLGAGTVTTADDARAAIAAGADFLVSPGLVLDVLAVAATADVLCLPGTLTPTEVLAARAAGARVVKWFPASLGGPGMLRDVRAAIRGIDVVPTGGIDSGNAREYLDAGALAVGVGSWLTADAGRVGERAAALREACGTS